MKKYNIEFIEWVDSTQSNDWLHTKYEENLNCHGCFTVGFVIEEDSDKIIFALSIADVDGKDEQTSARIAIPKISIISRRVLKKAK